MEAGAATAAPADFRLAPARPRIGEKAIKGVLFLAAMLSVLTTVGIVVALLGETPTFFAEVSIVDYLTGTQWTPLFANASFGVLPLITGTLLVTGIALLVATPLGLASAFYLSEYASPRVRRAVKPVELRERLSIVIVTHSMQQAARVSQMTAFLTVANAEGEGGPDGREQRTGRIVEYDRTDAIFTNPEDPRTEAYVSGKVG